MGGPSRSLFSSAKVETLGSLHFVCKRSRDRASWPPHVAATSRAPRFLAAVGPSSDPLDDITTLILQPFLAAAPSAQALDSAARLGNLVAEGVIGRACQVLVAPHDPAVATSLQIGACARLQGQAAVFPSTGAE